MGNLDYSYLDAFRLPSVHFPETEMDGKGFPSNEEVKKDEEGSQGANGKVF